MVYAFGVANAGETGRQTLEASADNYQLFLWPTAEGFFVSETTDNGLNFSLPVFHKITGEVITSPVITSEGEGATLLTAVAEEMTGLNKIIVSALPSFEPQTIFSTHDVVKNLGLSSLPDILLVFWQTEYFDRTETYYAFSLDTGSNFSPPVKLELDSDIQDLIVNEQQITAIVEEEQIAFETICPAPPLILSPANEFQTKQNDLIISYQVDSRTPLRNTIKLTSVGQIYVFEQLTLANSSETIEFTSPVDLLDGEYQLEISSSNGIKSSLNNPSIAISIDNTPPMFVSFEAKAKFGQYSFEGQINESPARLVVNSKEVELDDNGIFYGSLPLISGKNIFNLLLTDEAQNVTLVTREVFYNSASPEIEVVSPQITEWFKPKSTLMIEAKVYDLQNDIADGTSAEIKIKGKTVSGFLSYDLEEKTISGFVLLPDSLPDGHNRAQLSILDTRNNLGRVDIEINIDGQAPVMTQQTVYAKTGERIVLPVADQGAGLDLAATIIEWTGSSLEGTVSSESDNLVFNAKKLLTEGSYEAVITARDNIGNIAAASPFSLIIDNIPPVINLISSMETEIYLSEYDLRAEIIDDNLDKVTLTNNEQIIHSDSTGAGIFTGTIRLLSGSNNLVIKAKDKAGNFSLLNLSIIAHIVPNTGLISQCLNGPNPFAPQKELTGSFSTLGKGMVFSYALNQPSDVVIRIYDITGTQIWSKKIGNTAAGVTAWNGIDHFGRISDRGIYPYIFSATSGDITESRRGTILISPTAE
ncbi:MAG: hypothetical protein ABIE84_05605 [bacterium]